MIPKLVESIDVLLATDLCLPVELVLKRDNGLTARPGAPVY